MQKVCATMKPTTPRNGHFINHVSFSHNVVFPVIFCFNETVGSGKVFLCRHHEKTHKKHEGVWGSTKGSSYKKVIYRPSKLQPKAPSASLVSFYLFAFFSLFFHVF
jgi:hypothetical protein